MQSVAGTRDPADRRLRTGSDGQDDMCAIVEAVVLRPIPLIVEASTTPTVDASDCQSRSVQSVEVD